MQPPRDVDSPKNRLESQAAFMKLSDETDTSSGLLIADPLFIRSAGPAHTSNNRAPFCKCVGWVQGYGVET